MAYTFWKIGRTEDIATFDLFFRKNPFNGEFTIFCGLSECIAFIKDYKISESDIEYLKTILPSSVEDAFYDYLRDIDCSKITLIAIDEGSIVFPKVPLISVEGPLIHCQLLETTLLNLVNYSSLIATNAARFRMAAGPSKELFEFGLRRAQGPNGAVIASKYAYIGGFDSTSNLLSAKLYGLPLSGTHAHSFVISFLPTDNFTEELTLEGGNQTMNFGEICGDWRIRITKAMGISPDQMHKGEYLAFKASGIINFSIVSLALIDCGYQPVGVRIDSGDLAYLSVEIRKFFKRIAELFSLPSFETLKIVASNDLNEETLLSLHTQNHSIDSFGIGTHLVTCQKQPALGCVYKLVVINGKAVTKLSEEVQKMVISGRKVAYRLFGKDGIPLVDYMQFVDEPEPRLDERILCQHAFQASTRVYVVPSKIEKLHNVFFENGQIVRELSSVNGLREHVRQQLSQLRNDHKRSLNPTPYKVSVSYKLYKFVQALWSDVAPIGELS